jgi:serine/threonine-protein kinase HipA
MNSSQLSIRLHGKPVGILEQTKTGKKTFIYNNDAEMPISIGMPLREESYGDQQCEAFFGGLLPESEAVKKIIGKKFSISPNNSFALLKVIGHDCAGAISCHAMDEPIVSQTAVPLKGRIIDDDELYQHIIELPKKPLFIDVDGMRLSLAGVQDKAAVCIIDEKVAIPEDGCPTTHILKPSSKFFEGVGENEYFILRLAKGLGLPVPEVELKKIKDINFLLIERYDRAIKNKYIERIHQEDFCQALSISSNRKYENEGGPGLKDCFELLKKSTKPAINRNLLASAMVFNYLIGNMDAHSKNFSLLHNSTSNIQLAPFYDILCTRVYKDLTSKMAMKIGKYKADEVLPKHWKQLCENIGYRYLTITNLIEKFGQNIMNIANQEKLQLEDKGIKSPIIDQIITFLEWNINQTLRRFKDSKS